MAKLIQANELAEIVTGLLVAPQLFGELDECKTHQAFMQEIGEVVATYCGGHVEGISRPETTKDYLNHPQSTPCLSVTPNDSLPSIDRNVWSIFDASGWEEELGSEHDGNIQVDEKQIAELRANLQTLLVGSTFELPIELADWETGEGEPIKGLLISNDIGLAFRFEGYSDCCSEDSKGFPVFLENYEGQVSIRVSSNINSEEPTHVINLSGARNDRRLDEN